MTLRFYLPRLDQEVKLNPCLSLIILFRIVLSKEFLSKQGARRENNSYRQLTNSSETFISFDFRVWEVHRSESW
jgi:hypothetical protein